MYCWGRFAWCWAWALLFSFSHSHSHKLSCDQMTSLILRAAHAPTPPRIVRLYVSIVCCCCFFAVFCLIKFCHFVLFLIFGGGTLYKSDFNLYLENCWVCVLCVFMCSLLFQFNLNCFAFCRVGCFSCVIFKTKLARFLPSMTA